MTRIEQDYIHKSDVISDGRGAARTRTQGVDSSRLREMKLCYVTWKYHATFGLFWKVKTNLVVCK